MSSRLTGQKILIKGQVQGVFFRRHAKSVADKLGVFGWIRNMEDGSVEALVQGRKDAIDKFVDWCRSGPDMAQVDEIIVGDEKTGETYSSFEIIG